MKKLVALLIGVGLIAGSAQADLLLAWDTLANPTGTGVVSSVSTFNATGIQDQQLITRGAGLNPASAIRGFGANNYTSTNAAGAVTANDYMQWTIAADPNWTFSVTQLVFQVSRSSTGPTNLFLRTSSDNFIADILVWGTNNVGTTRTAISVPVNIASTNNLTFRLYGYAGQSTGSFRFDGGLASDTLNELEIYGVAIPEPGTFILIALGLSFLTFARRRMRI
jgi:hypothetical protein